MKSFKQDKNASSEPTKSELEILQVLWEFGPSTVRFVNDHLNEERREVNYMSTQKLMLIMLDKGFVTKDASQMTMFTRRRQMRTKPKARCWTVW